MFRPGEIVGQRYAIVDRLAIGGMATVYRAQHLVSRHEVALKVLNVRGELDSRAIERFKREASIAAEIAHEGLVTVLDAGFDMDLGCPFIVMELLQGEHLGHRLAREGTTLADGLVLIDRMLAPLEAMHLRGFVHRDLKPENVFVTIDASGREGVKVLDFGIAKNLEAQSASLTGSALGTPYYMAPEQVLSSKHVTAAADVWSVGVMAFEMATGRLPFEGPTPESVLVKACTQRPPRLAEVGPHASSALARVIDRCLQNEASERPQNATELRAELRAALVKDGAFDAHPIAIARFRGTARRSNMGSEPTVLDPNTAPRTGWRTVSGQGWSLEVPPSWRSRETMVPHVGASWEAPDAIDGFRPRMVLKVEAFDGDTRAYGELGIENTQKSGRLIRTSDATLAGRPCLECELVFDVADPAFRALRRGIVVDGCGYMLGVDAPILRFVEHMPTFKAIFSSFIVAGAPTL